MYYFLNSRIKKTQVKNCKNHKPRGVAQFCKWILCFLDLSRVKWLTWKFQVFQKSISFLYPLPLPWLDFFWKSSFWKFNLVFLTCGVSKESILGPLLFLVYINNIHKSDSVASFCLFADNTNLSFAEKNIERRQHKPFLSRKEYRKTRTKVNTSLENITNWLKVNKNQTLTNHILFNKSNHIFDLSPCPNNADACKYTNK